MGTRKVERGIYRVENKDGTISWMIDYLNPDKKRIRKTFKTKKQAVAERAKRISLIGEGEYSDFIKELERKPNSHTLGNLIQSYKISVKRQSSFHSAKKTFLDNIESYFGTDTLLEDITYQDLFKFKNFVEAKITRHGRKRKISSVNREVSCLRDLFKYATGRHRKYSIEQKMIAKSPFDEGASLHERNEQNKRKNFLLENQLHNLLAELPHHAYRCTVCAALTGLDWKDIQNLRQSQVRGGFIYGLRSKTGEEFSIPVHPELQKIFDEVTAVSDKKSNVIDLKSGKKKRRPTPEADPLLFTLRGEKIGSIKTAFNSACDRAGIAYGREVPGGITFKDLRHTFASHFLKKGGTLEELQELMAHSDITTTKRYAHITAEHKRKVLLQMTGLIKSDSESHVSSCQLKAQSE